MGQLVTALAVSAAFCSHCCLCPLMLFPLRCLKVCILGLKGPRNKTSELPCFENKRSAFTKTGECTGILDEASSLPASRWSAVEFIDIRNFLNFDPVV